MNIADLRRRYQGFSDDEIVEALRATKYTDFSVQEIKDVLGIKPPTRSLFAVANDAVIEAGNAVAGTAGAVANFVSPGNSFSQGVEQFIAGGEASQSDAVKADKAKFRERMDSAQGMGDEAAAVGGYIVNAPLIALSQAVGSIAVPAGAIGVAGKVAGAAGAGARGVQATGLAAGAGLGAAGAGGDAAGTAYELAIKAGATEEQAQDAARQASIIPAAVGGLGGVVGAERLLAGAKGFGGKAVSRALKTGAVEGLQEGIEEGITQYEGQRAVVPLDPSIDPMKGVAGAATMGAALGAAAGGGLGLLTGGGQEQALRRKAADVALADLGQSTTVDQAVAAFTAATDVPLTPDAPQNQPARDLRAKNAETLTTIRALEPEQQKEALQLLALVDNPRTPTGPRRMALERLAELEREATTIPAGEAAELLPTGDARELTDAERAAYAAGDKTPDQQLREQRLRDAPARIRAKLGLPPAVEATELVPTPDVLEVEPIPAGDAFEDIPTPEAAELLPVGDAAEVLPTPDVIEPVDQVPTGEATDIEPEQADTGLLLTGDGQPYGTRSGAYVRAKREGLPAEAVVEVPGGWAVKKESIREDQTPSVRDVEGSDSTLRGQEPQDLSVVRRERRHDLSGVAQRFRGIRQGGGAEANAEALDRQDRQPERVRAGQLPVGNDARTSREQTREPQVDSPGGDANLVRSGEGGGDQARDAGGATERWMGPQRSGEASAPFGGQGGVQRRSQDGRGMVEADRSSRVGDSQEAETELAGREGADTDDRQKGAAQGLIVKALSAQWAQAVARGDMAEARRLNDAIVEAKKPPAPPAPPPAAAPAQAQAQTVPAAETREQAIRRVWGAAPRTMNEWTPITVSVGDRKNDMLAIQRKARGDGKGDSAITMRVIRMGKRIASEPQQPLLYTFRLTGENKVEQVGAAKVPSAADVAEWEAAGFAVPGKKAEAIDTSAERVEQAAQSEQVAPEPAAHLSAWTLAPPDQEPVKQQPVVAPEVSAETPSSAPEPIKNEAPAAPTKTPAPPQQTRPQELIELRKRAAVLKQLLECLG